MPSETIEIRDDKLKGLLKAFSAKIPQAKVGILGDKSARSGNGQSNAEIGASHEFGTSELPQRSFLRMPITEHLESYLEDARVFDKEALNKVIKDKSIFEWVSKIAITGEQIVAEAFATCGFGKWKSSNMSYKKNHQTLVETQQLRNSITSEVK